MTVRKLGRRWFLRGAGAALAIPALPSLLRSPAQAQGEVAPRRMVMFMTEHGGIWKRWMFPEDGAARTPLAHPLHQAHQGTLEAQLRGDERFVTDVLRAPAHRFTASIASKMNVIQGLDVPFYFGHARHLLGNYGEMSSNHSRTTPEQETADQLLARSPSMYEGTPRRRVMNFSRRALSVELRDPSVGPSAGFRQAEVVTAQSVFDAVYVRPDAGAPDEPQQPPIDVVYGAYERLASGAFGAGARLGSEDRQRLSQYMDRLSDIRSAMSSGVGNYCSLVEDRDDYPGQWNSRYSPENYRLINDIILAGFMCDSSRIAIVRVEDPFSTAMESDGGYHEVAHGAAATDAGAAATATRLAGLLRDGKQRFFERGFLDLAEKLEELPEGAGTMLDNSLVWWAQEAGSKTHQGDSIPVVTVGSAGGRLNTGRYFDFRDRDGGQWLREDDRELCNEGRRRGACYFQWTTTWLDAFGVPREMWQTGDRRSFTPMSPQETWHRPRYDHVAMDASCDEPLPGLLAG